MALNELIIATDGRYVFAAGNHEEMLLFQFARLLFANIVSARHGAQGRQSSKQVAGGNMTKVKLTQPRIEPSKVVFCDRKDGTGVYLLSF